MTLNGNSKGLVGLVIGILLTALVTSWVERPERNQSDIGALKTDIATIKADVRALGERLTELTAAQNARLDRFEERLWPGAGQ